MCRCARTTSSSSSTSRSRSRNGRAPYACPDSLPWKGRESGGGQHGAKCRVLMIAYILRSIAQAILVMLAVALLAFSMFRFVGDPVANMVGQEASLKERAELAERLGLN